ncbi:MAG: hypothetical protein WCQ95_13855 [Bacteroidota bacterium]
MKKIFLALFIVGSIAYAGQAQTSRTNTTKAETNGQGKNIETPAQKAQGSVEKLDKTVTLTADQKTQVYNLALARSKKVEEITTKYKGQADKKEIEKQEIQAARNEYQVNVKKILTAEQIKKMDAAEKANKENAGQKK